MEVIFLFTSTQLENETKTGRYATDREKQGLDKNICPKNNFEVNLQQ